jgi:hypothetical protein
LLTIGAAFVGGVAARWLADRFPEPRLPDEVSAAVGVLPGSTPSVTASR